MQITYVSEITLYQFRNFQIPAGFILKYRIYYYS